MGEWTEVPLAEKNLCKSCDTENWGLPGDKGLLKRRMPSAVRTWVLTEPMPRWCQKQTSDTGTDDTEEGSFGC